MFARSTKIVTRKPHASRQIFTSNFHHASKLFKFTAATTIVGAVVGGVAFMYYELKDPFIKYNFCRPKKLDEIPPFTLHMVMISLLGIMYGGVVGALWPITIPVAIGATISYANEKE